MESFDARLNEHLGVFIGLEVVGALFLILIIAETVLDYKTGRRRNLKESFANGFIALVNTLIDRTVIGVIFVVGLLFAESFAFVAIPVAWWSWGLAILAADFTYYWMHRAEHEIRAFWAAHSTHHSSPEYNLTTSFRLSWLETFFEWIFFVPMVLIGFDIIQVLGSLLIVVVYQTWIHTERVEKLGWLDGVFNTPSVHRVHHGSNPEYIDKNYGGILILWDRLFGTFEREVAPVVYGITEPLKTSNPFSINFREFANIGRDVSRAQTWRDGWFFLVKRPGWQPNSQRSDLDQHPQDI